MNILILPESAIGKSEFVLEDLAQIHHVLNILQLSNGDRVKIGFMQGKIGTALIKQINVSDLKSNRNNNPNNSRQIILTDFKCELPPPKKLNLTVVLALPRPKVLRRLIMDMTAIGVNEVILVNSYRTDKSYWQSPMLQRFDEFVQLGLQQAVDTIPPIITLHKRFKPFVEDTLSLKIQSKLAVVAHPHSDVALSNYQLLKGLPQVLCIGAEGGWVDYEVELLKSIGCQDVSLGERILRTEAAVNVLCGRYLA